MVDRLRQGSDWLEGQRHKHLSHEVTYRRGSLSAVVKATDGRSDFEQMNDHGIGLQSQARDFIVRAEDLVLGGVRVLPQAGDRIEEVLAGGTQGYEVISPGGVPAWEWADPGQIDLRIHTKWTGAVS